MTGAPPCAELEAVARDLRSCQIGPVEKVPFEEVFVEAGLQPEVAARAAEETVARLLAREPSLEAGTAADGGFASALVKNPMLSVSRILREDDIQLPLYDPGTRRVSAASMMQVLIEAGLEPAVAMAFSRVVVELCEPEDFYRPVWKALGRTDEVDLRTLARLDWSVLRTERTVRVPVKKPKRPNPELAPPGAAKKGPGATGPEAKPRRR